MPQWLLGIIGSIGFIVAIVAVTLLVLEFQFRRELKRCFRQRAARCAFCQGPLHDTGSVQLKHWHLHPECKEEVMRRLSRFFGNIIEEN